MNPRFQGGIALRFAAVALACSVLFGLSFHGSARGALRSAALQGHYHFLSAYDILGGVLARHVAVLSAGVLAADLFVLLLLVRKVRAGVAGLVDSFRRSTEGDLSSLTAAPALSGITDLAKRIDGTRSRTLSRIRKIREEVEFLRSEPLSDEEFAKRWDALKASVRKVAP